MASTARLPWWGADDTVQKFQRSIAEAQEQLRCMPRAGRAHMKARAFVSTVMVSCDAESIPARILQAEEAFQILTKLYNEILHAWHTNLTQFDRRFFYQCEHEWPWQHHLSTGNLPHAKAACLSQMKQHLKALMFLCICNKDKTLSIPLLKSTHAILMKGYVQHEDPTMHNGCFREFAISFEGAIVIHETTIPSSLKDMLRRLHADDEPLAPGVPYHHRPRNYFDFPERCATLVHDMTHIQPFPYGNEWMCRLILAFFMVTHDGFAFPVPIAPITERTPQEFLHGLFAPDDDRLQLQEDSAAGFRREKALLSAYILECVWESLEEVMCSNQQDYY